MAGIFSGNVGPTGLHIRQYFSGPHWLCILNMRTSRRHAPRHCLMSECFVPGVFKGGHL
jgi:hypothetical protein